MMENFEQKLINDIQVKILHEIQKNDILKIDYQSRFTVPPDIVEKSFRSIDSNKIIELVKNNLEEHIAKTIVNQMTTEVSTDTKRLMSDSVTREKLKYLVYPKIMEIIDGGK